MAAEANSQLPEDEQRHANRKLKFICEKLGCVNDKLNLPFPIKDGRINEKNELRYHSDHLNDWTTSLRFLLIDCQHLILLQNILDSNDIASL